MKSTQEKKKVIFFIPTLTGGGAERVVSELSLNMPDFIEQYIVLFENKVSYPHKGIVRSLGLQAGTTKNLLAKAMQVLMRFIGFRKIVNEIRPDAVFSFLEANKINALVGAFSIRNKYNVILSERTATSRIELITKGFYGFINRISIRLLYNTADRIITVSEGIKEDLVKNFNINSNKVRAIYNPIDAGKLNSLVAEEVEHPWFNDNVPLVINIGRLAKQKNQMDLLTGMRDLKKDTVCRLIIIGEGELREDLKATIKSLGLENDVALLGFQKNPFKYIKRASLFVLSSMFEGFPNVLVEAMALGCPVISSDCPTGPGEILSPGIMVNPRAGSFVRAKYGILFKVGDVNGMVAGIRELLGNEQLRRTYSELGKERVRDFSTTKIVNSYLSYM